jgi:cytochrome P450
MTIPPGITVAPCIYLAHHREAAYPDPDVFRPERFLERVTSPHEYLPFGGGARRCIGLGLALHEMKIVLGTLLSTFQLELVDPDGVEPVRRSVTVAPSGGPLMRVRSRTTTSGITIT